MSETRNQSRPKTPEQITADVLASFEGASDARLREIMQALVRHLHAFAAEVALTPQEWTQAIEILTRTGDITDEHRQEFVLWSDSLGLSMLVDAIENTLPEGATESTVLGPFYVPGSPLREHGANIAQEDDAGVPALVRGRVLDTDGAPIAGAELDVWQNGDDRLYAVQRPEGPEDHLRGRFITREDGSYAFVAVRPVPYPIPYDGPVGQMLEAAGRHPWRPAHIHMIVRADGFRTLTTHIFDRASEYLDSDAVFAVKPSLMREFVAHRPDEPGTPAGVTSDWVSVANDIVLVPAAAAGNGALRSGPGTAPQPARRDPYHM
jgi:hydroxyquinol 1,2-dioxygenase